MSDKILPTPDQRAQALLTAWLAQIASLSGNVSYDQQKAYLKGATDAYQDALNNGWKPG